MRTLAFSDTEVFLVVLKQDFSYYSRNYAISKGNNEAQ